MRKIIVILAAFVIFTVAVFGCGRKDQDHANDSNTDLASTEENVSVGEMGTESVLDTESTSQLQLGSAVEIPENFEGYPSEANAHEQLERAIAEYANVSEKDYASVRYCYNYVDLNGDGKNEILAFVMGEEVEGIDGNMLLWLDEPEDEKISAGSIRQTFRQAGIPVYISNHVTQEYRDLIITDFQTAVDGGEDMNSAARADDVDVSNAGRTVDGEPTSLQRTAGLDETTGENGVVPISMNQTYMLLTWKGDKYQEYEEGTALFSLEGYEGLAILTSNIENDMSGDNCHFLGEAMK